MKPMFALQVTGRHDDDLHATVKALDEMGLEWKDFGVIPFEDTITNLEAFPVDRPVIPLGGTKLLSMYLKQEKPGDIIPANWFFSYDEHFMDQEFAQDYLGKHLFNNDDTVQYWRYANVRKRCWASPVFIKPTNDLKAFAGMTLDIGQCLDDALGKITHQPLDDDQKILVASVKNIGREFRLFVVDGKIIDASEYRSQHGIKAKVIDMYTAFRLARFFDQIWLGFFPQLMCMDVCEELDASGNFVAYKVVEINCFHCSGMYAVDRAVVLMEVAAYVERYIDFLKRKQEDDKRPLPSFVYKVTAVNKSST